MLSPSSLKKQGWCFESYGLCRAFEKHQFLSVKKKTPANSVWTRGKQREKDGFPYLTGSVWALFHSEEVQAENLTSIGVVNQVAKLHYLQLHDNPFNA